MKIDLEVISKLRSSKIFKVANVHKSQNNYEYIIAKYSRGNVIGILNLEHEILDINNEIIGYFGVDFVNKVLAYKINGGNKK